MGKTEEVLFNYVRDIIYNPKKAAIDLNEIDESFHDVAKGLTFLNQCLLEVRVLAERLAEGDLESPLPGTHNVIAYPLKALHSSLKHLVWQARQIQKGDLRQTVDFLGDFSKVFNNMRDELKSTRETLESQVFRDPLTMLFNRRYIMAALEHMVKEKKPFSLCFVDLDNLKYINDVLGHLEGDKFIVGVADRLKTDLSEGVVARVGGDEYMALLPKVSEIDATVRMEEICAKLSHFGARPDGKTRYPLSYGVFESKEDDGLSVSQILAEADKRMYALKAKHKASFLNDQRR